MTLEKEILKIRIALEKETNKDIRKILSKQKKQLEQMRELVGSIYMKYADDEGIINISNVDRTNVMRNIEKSIIKNSKEMINYSTNITDETLLKSYVDSYYKTASTIDKGVSVGINYKLLRKEFIDAVVNAKFENMTYSDRIWKNTNKLADKLYDVIGKGISDGTSIQKLSKEIKDAFGTSAFESKRLVNTEMARVTTEAQNNIYKDSGIVNKVIWISTLDDLTNPEDASLDGTVWDVNDTSRPQIPLHPNCRCTIAPYIEGWSPTTRRDNITKEEIPYTDYKSWKKDN